MIIRLSGALILISLIKCSYAYFAVEKCPGTDVPNIRQQKDFNEISLIFYYTQWSDESLEALQQFNDVAAVLGERVYFAAIDCWHLACNCSNTLSTARGSGYPHKWPTLMLYYSRVGYLKIQYHGLFTFRNMLNFVLSAMRPLERIEGREELEQMKRLADGIVLGLFESPNSMEYKQYLIASLKWLEHDPIRSYRFFVSFGSANKNFNETVKEPNLLLFGHKNNKSFVENNSYQWNTSVILRWLNEEFVDAYGILHGYSTPFSIAQKIKKQPVLAIFVNEPQEFFPYMEKYVNKQKPFSKALHACKLAEKRKEKLRDRMKLLKNSNVLQTLTRNDSQSCYYQKDVILKNLKFYFEINQFINHQQVHFVKHLNCDVNELISFFRSTKCLQQKDMALETSLHISLVKRLEEYLTHEQQCRMSNCSLSVVLLDTHRYKDFLDNLNIIPTQQSMATVFIVDNQKENIFVMEDRFAMYNLMEFVKKFYSNALNNYFKSMKAKPSFSTSSLSQKYDIVLKELNRDIFLNHLKYVHNQTLVVLIHSPECALCGNIQHYFMQLTLLLQHVNDLKFIRVNVMDNDLPWQFNMPFLPALLVLPQNRFSESRLFPTHLKPDIRNVFGFILSQLPANQQVRLAVAMCHSEALAKSHIASCWQFAKTILMQHIGKHLQYWQIFEAERSLIFERLRAFKDLSLDVQRNLRL